MNNPDTFNTLVNAFVNAFINASSVAANTSVNSAADALQQLRDIHLPESAGWWPPAPGWWLLAAVVLVCLVLAIGKWRSWRRRNRRWQAVQQELMALRAQSQTQNSLAWFGQLNALLKRAARDSYPSQPVASMTGKDWIVFLQHTFMEKSGNTAVDAELIASLVTACWQPNSSCDPQHAVTFAELWLQKHKKQLRSAP